MYRRSREWKTSSWGRVFKHHPWRMWMLVSHRNWPRLYCKKLIYFKSLFLVYLFKKIKMSFCIPQFRWILEIIQWAYSILYLLQFTSELYIQSLKMYLRTLGKSPFKVLFIISLLTTLSIIPFRFTCLDVIEDHCIIIAIILKGMYVLYLGK